MKQYILLQSHRRVTSMLVLGHLEAPNLYEERTEEQSDDTFICANKGKCLRQKGDADGSGPAK